MSFFHVMSVLFSSGPAVFDVCRNQLRLAPFQNLKMDEEITCVMYRYV